MLARARNTKNLKMPYGKNNKIVEKLVKSAVERHIKK
jgi:hypothetical protein